MLKKLFLCLILVMALSIGGIDGAFAIEDGQTCTLLKGAKILQVMPDRSMRRIIVPEDVSVLLGPMLKNETALRLNEIGQPFDWTGSHMALIEVDFGAGLVPVMIVVRPENVKDCK